MFGILQFTKVIQPFRFRFYQFSCYSWVICLLFGKSRLFWIIFGLCNRERVLSSLFTSSEDWITNREALEFVFLSKLYQRMESMDFMPYLFSFVQNEPICIFIWIHLRNIIFVDSFSVLFPFQVHSNRRCPNMKSPWRVHCFYDHNDWNVHFK